MDIPPDGQYKSKPYWAIYRLGTDFARIREVYPYFLMGIYPTY
jgi:hypothetical protein